MDLAQPATCLLQMTIEIGRRGRNWGVERSDGLGLRGTPQSLNLCVWS